MSRYRGCLLRCVFWVGFVLAANATCAQEFPSRPVRIYTGSPGSNVANAARFLAQGMGPALGQSMIVDNRGGGAAVFAELLSKASPDGYALALVGGSFWIGPLLESKPSYDPIKGYTQISLVARAPGLIVIHPSLPVKSIKDLIVYAKAHPGQLNYGTGGDGGIGHLAGELFNALAGVKIVRVRYSNDAVQTTELLSGLVEMTFAGTNVMQYVKAGKLRALGVTSDKPSSLFPGVPAAGASLPGYSVFATDALVAPAGVSKSTMLRLNEAVAHVLEQPATKDHFLTGGLEATSSTPEELTALIKAEMDTAGKIIKNMGIHLN